MALRNQPYLPLYVQDFLTDEKLLECSAESTGVYIRLLCVMHKSDEYGTILLKQNNKQTGKQVEDFAYKLAKYMPYRIDIIHKALHELINEGVIQVADCKLLQKRMIRDNDISNKRSLAGSLGGKKTQFAKAKVEANSEYENETENETAKETKKKKSIYGEYKHVRLTDEEFKKLTDRFGDTKTRDLIKELDEGIELKGYKYTNHYLAIIKWSKNAKSNLTPQQQKLKNQLKDF